VLALDGAVVPAFEEAFTVPCISPFLSNVLVFTTLTRAETFRDTHTKLGPRQNYLRYAKRLVQTARSDAYFTSTPLFKSLKNGADILSKCFHMITPFHYKESRSSQVCDNLANNSVAGVG